MKILFKAKPKKKLFIREKKEAKKMIPTPNLKLNKIKDTFTVKTFSFSQMSLNGWSYVINVVVDTVVVAAVAVTVVAAVVVEWCRHQEKSC